MKTDVDPSTHPADWSRAWHAQRNAQVAALVADGGCLFNDGRELTRDDSDDDTLRQFFRRHYTPEAQRTMSERAHSPDAYLYENVLGCILSGRNDERRRIAKALSDGLQKLLGDEFRELLFDIANTNDLLSD